MVADCRRSVSGLYDVDFRVSGSKLLFWGFGFRLWGLGFRVYGFGFGAQGLGFRV